MQQLTGQAAMFLYLDQPHAGSQGLLVYLYDQSSAPGGRVPDPGYMARCLRDSFAEMKAAAKAKASKARAKRKAPASKGAPAGARNSAN